MFRCVIAINAFIVVGCAGVQEKSIEVPRVSTDQMRQTLTSSTDGGELEKAAMGLCSSGNKDDLQYVLGLLKSPEFLVRLDSREDYQKARANLRIGRLFQLITRLRTNVASDAFVLLGKEPVFIDERSQLEYGRLRLLVVAGGLIKDPSDNCLDVFEQLALSYKPTWPLVIRALVKTRSPKACKRLEKIFLAGGGEKWWFTDMLIECRDDNAVIGLFKGLMEAGVEDGEMRNLMVQSLFDYRLEWYSPHTVRKPPSRKKAATSALRELLKLADLSKKIELTEDTRASINRARQEIARILDFREKEAPKIPAILKDLGSDNFQLRDRASRELTHLGDLAEPDLRQSLRSDLPLETRRRVEDILRKLETLEK